VTRLSWRKEPNETGLRAVGQGPRGVELRVKGTRLATVSPLSAGWQSWKGWYWVCPSNPSLGIKYCNTCSSPCETQDEAKEECEKYVRAAMCLPERR
jgi:hypothetical protein